MKKSLLGAVLCLLPMAIVAQSQPIQLDEVLVSAVRAKQTNPVTFSNLSKKTIKEKNTGQQLPLLLNQLPNVVSYSEDGTGFGATNMFVRGSNLERINVTINGVPFNDAESHGVFWYNLSDFAASAENIQLQRGVGTSSNGSGAFGASLNVLTDAIQNDASAEIANYYGSYNTHKHAVKLSTGKINDRFELSGRFSVIKSDGYRDRASSDLKSYFLQGAYAYGGTLIKALLFGGRQHVYLTYIGLDKETLEKDRRYNPAGEYYDAAGNKHFYNNETDNYAQDHAQLHWSQQWGTSWNSHLAFHYTKGKGYWENYEKKAYSKVGLPSLGKDAKGKEKKAYIIHQQGLDNDFYGTTFDINYHSNKLEIIFGGLANRYEGSHYKDLLWAEKASFTYGNRYSYEGINPKGELSAFTKITWQLTPHWSLFGDLQYRHVTYRADKYNVNEHLSAFNPKGGITFSINPDSHLYISYARATKEPNRSDYKNYTDALADNPEAKKPLPEKLNDFELGWRFTGSDLQLNLNAYYMQYTDQLALTGKLNATGYPIRENVGKSYRAGVELNLSYKISDRWLWQPNLAYSQNKNKNYKITDPTDKTKTIDLGDTPISYSPAVVAGNTLTFFPLKNLGMSLITKYVSNQYVDNTKHNDAKLEAYWVNNFAATYLWKPRAVAKEVLFSVQGNNILNNKYVAYANNDYGMSYIPAAEANYLVGVTITF